jgi:hypothetical protein
MCDFDGVSRCECPILCDVWFANVVGSVDVVYVCAYPRYSIACRVCAVCTKTVCVVMCVVSGRMSVRIV